ncbi:MAG: nitrous oxide reductase family maturation protein NosD [Candidatus Hodarchaeota archaeon]
MKQKLKKKYFVLLLGLIVIASIFIDPNFDKSNEVNDNNFEKTTKERSEENFLKTSGSWDLTGSPIYIEDDDPSYNWLITTATKPWCRYVDGVYIIENVTIDGQNSGSCISIRDSSVRFIIRNCTLYNAGSNEASHDSGIKLEYVDNGVITNNTSSNNNLYGISLENSNNITLSFNNIAFNDAEGIYIDGSYKDCVDNVLDHNKINHNGNSGIVLDGYGIFGGSLNKNNITHNILNFNGQNGLPAPAYPSPNYLSGIYVYFSDYNILLNNTVNNNTIYGISLFRSDNNILLENKVYNNTDTAIRVVNCEQTTIKKNLVIDNDYGIEMWAVVSDNCRYNEIVENYIINNDLYGIYIGSEASDNDIYYNNFSNNVINALDDGSNNAWDNEGTGNFWSDYTTKYPSASNDGFVWNISYEIGGSASAQDNYPLCSSKPILVFEISSNYLNTTTPLETDKGLKISCSFLHWYNLELEWVYLCENSNSNFVNRSMSQLANGDWMYIVNISALNAGDVLMFSFYVKYNPIVHFDNSGLNYSIRIRARIIAGGITSDDDDDDDDDDFGIINGYNFLILLSSIIGIITILIIKKKVHKTN